MTSPRKSQWKTLQRLAEHLVFNEAPKIVRQLNSPRTQREIKRGIQWGIQQGIKVGLQIGADALGGAASQSPSAIATGRPVTSTSFPTAQRARKLVYAPNLGGRADPGEIVWTWVAYEDDHARGQDQPVLVVGRDRHTLLGLTLSSEIRHAGDRDWVGIDAGSWDDPADGLGRPSWVRLDRVLDVPEEGIRREGAVLDRGAFEIIAARLRADYCWS